MGLTEAEFWHCTPHFFVHKLNGMRSILQATNEVQTRRSWEQARFIAWAAGHWKDGTKMEDIIRFDWEIGSNGDTLEYAKMLRQQWRWNEPDWGKLSKKQFD